MFFRVKYILRDLGLAEGETISFTDAPSQTSLEIRRPTDNEEPLFRERECFGVLQTQEAVTKKVRAQFENHDKPGQAVSDIGTKIARRLHEYLEHAISVILWRCGDERLPTILANHLGRNRPPARHNPRIYKGY